MFHNPIGAFRRKVDYKHENEIDRVVGRVCSGDALTAMGRGNVCPK